VNLRACFLVGLLGSVAWAAPVHAGIKDQAPNGFTIENSQWVLRAVPPATPPMA